MAGHSGESSALGKWVWGAIWALAIVMWLWPYSLILIVGIALFLLWDYGRPMLGAFSQRAADEATRLARRRLLLVFLASSFGNFLAMAFTSNPALYGFIGSAAGFIGLYLSRLELKGAGGGRGARLLRTLISNLTELLAVFGVVAGIYAVAAIYLRLAVVDGGTVRELMRLDDRLLYARVFLEQLKFSAWQTIAIGLLLVGLRAVERRLAGQQARVTDAAWRGFRVGTKWMSRAALVTLFAASFTLLAARTEGLAGEVSARIRDFEEAYSELRGSVEKAIEQKTKRELITKTWTMASQTEKAAIKQSIDNRKAAQKLGEEYQDLKKAFDVQDKGVEDLLQRETAPLEPAEETTGHVMQADAPQGVPRDAQNVVLETVQNAAEEAKRLVEAIQKEEVPEPAKSMQEAIGTNVMDFAFDTAKEHVRFFELLNAHFPGAGEFLGSVTGAVTESFLASKKEAKAKAVASKLKSPEEPLETIVRETVSSLITTVALEPMGVGTARANSALAGARAEDLRRATQALAARAHAIEEEELSASAERIQRMKDQIAKLRELGTEPKEASRVKDGGVLSSDHLEYRVPLRFGADFSNHQLGREFPVELADNPKSESKLDKFEGIALFQDPALNERTKENASVETRYETEISELVERNKEGHTSGTMQILGPEYSKYVRMTETPKIPVAFGWGQPYIDPFTRIAPRGWDGSAEPRPFDRPIERPRPRMEMPREAPHFVP